MDGDRAPLGDLMAIAERQVAMLFIDEAHATGVYDPQGRGLAASFEGRENVLVLHICSKALGGPARSSTARAYFAIFSSIVVGPSFTRPRRRRLMAVAALEALRVLQEEPQRRERLGKLVALAIDAPRSRDMPLLSDSQILPIIVGEDRCTILLAEALQARGPC